MILKYLESPNGDERVLILQRSDRCYSYRRQWRSVASRATSADEDEWQTPGPDCGIYDSADTAETEARQRVPWLKSQFH
jgi:hypothetical protein